MQGDHGLKVKGLRQQSAHLHVLLLFAKEEPFRNDDTDAAVLGACVEDVL